MLKELKTRIQQGYHTMTYPAGPPPDLPERFSGKPAIDDSICTAGCVLCLESCPAGAIFRETISGKIRIDMGRCIFCRNCEAVCPNSAVRFTRDFKLAACCREDLIIDHTAHKTAAFHETAHKIFGRSLKLRQVSAGGCNACEADTHVLNTLVWDLARFGIQFTASPRHADGLLVTGPVSKNMKTALEKTYHAVPKPKIVIAVGACAISGGIYRDLPEVCNGVSGVIPVDLYVPGCPPHPLTILDALLRFLGKTDR
ncbi:MAG: NADH-quinone oxidoreductase subunit NuoB [Desulfobacterales bacterium]|nr:NADH-quinone oxidoreductase subunit NuoB [Desulfobacterales bacterium]